MDPRREIFYPMLSAMLVLVASVFISCASQETVQNEDGTTVAEGAPTEEGAAPTEEAAAAPSETLAEDSENLDAELAKTEQPADGINLEENGEGIAALENVDAESNTPPAEDALGTEPDATPSLAEGTDSESLSEPEQAPVASSSEPTSEEPVEAVSEPVADASYSTATYSGSSIPEISAAFSKDGALLNRFYVVRKGDTAASLAQRFYGGSEAADRLARWNGGKKWLTRAGNVVYYASPNEPNDNQMRSFFEERGITPETYVVHAGDWLSTIAKNHYGDARSWKEVAVLNGIQNPDKIHSGKQLVLYPANLPDYSAPAPSQPQSAPQVNNQQETPVTEGTPPSIEELAPTQPDDVTITPKEKLDVKKLLNQNVFSMAVGGLILLLLLTLVILRRRRQSNEDDAQDEGYSQTKAKRN